MSTTRQVTDTLVHYIADNLTSDVHVHVLREDPADTASSVLQMNAVNIQFLDVTFTNGAGTGMFQVAIDVVNDDGNTVLDWVQSVATILTAAFFTRVLDYTDPTNPVETTSNIFWDADRVRFKRVTADQNYTQYTCVLPVRFRPI